MAFDFPASPTEGQQYSPAGGPVYTFTDGKWTVTSLLTATQVPFTPVGDIAATNVQAAVAELASEPKGWRNRIINGDFTVDQYRNGAALTHSAGTVYGFDRWLGTVAGTPGTFTMKRAADAELPGNYKMEIIVTAADAAPAVGNQYLFGQKIEGHNIRDLLWGNALAKPITISFMVWSKITGTFPIAIRNNGSTRSWLGSFTVNVAATWEKKTITVPGDVTGTWQTTFFTGLEVDICLAAGTTFQGVAGWQAGSFTTLAGMTNFMATINNDMYFRDFQVEAGSIATEFERLDYNDQLARCQRYYQISYRSVVAGSIQTSGSVGMYNGPTANLFLSMGFTSFTVEMKGTPTMVIYSPVTGASGMIRDITAAADRPSAFNAGSPNARGFSAYVNNSSVAANGVCGLQYVASAEL